MRIITALLLALLFAPTIRAFAHSGVYTKCVQTPTPILADGDASEAAWSNAIPNRVDHTKTVFGKADNDEDASFVLRTMWDVKNLYVAAGIKDDSISCHVSGSDMWRNDSLGICIDIGNDNMGDYKRDDHQFVFCPSSPRGIPQKYVYRNPFIHDVDPELVQLAAKLNEDGYTIELAIPWESLASDYTPKPYNVVGFHYGVRDQDGTDAPAGLTLTPSDDASANPLTWGDLILLPVAPKDETSAREIDESVAAIIARLGKGVPRYQRLIRGQAKEVDNSVSVAVSREVVNTLDLGIGWNWQYMRGVLPKWDDKMWEAFLSLLEWTKPQWIRYGLNLAQWEPSNDDDDPHHFNWKGFRFDSEIIQHHYRMLDFCEKKDIDVLVCNWWIGDSATKACWLAETIHDPELQDTDDEPLTDAPYDPSEFIESIAALLYQLKEVKKYDCVKYISLWNEPNGDWAYNSPNADYPSSFLPYYVLLDAKLRRMGIRDKIKIIGFDTSTGHYEELLKDIPDLLEKTEKVIDVVGEHDYKAFFDFKRTPNAKSVKTAMEAYADLSRKLKELYGRRVPIGVTEFGNTGGASGKVLGRDKIFDGSLFLGDFVIQGLNAGINGFLRWEFKERPRTWPNFAALDSESKRYFLAPFAPVYFPHSLLSRYTRRGSEVLRLETEGGKDENGVPRLHAAALRIPKTNDLTLLVANDGFVEKKLSVSFGELLKGKVLHHIYYDKGVARRLLRGEDVEVNDGGFSVPIKPRSINAFTSIEEGVRIEDLKLPFSISIPRQEPRYLLRDDGLVEKAIFRFESTYSWKTWRSSDGRTVVETSAERAHSGDRSCKIAYDFVSSAKLKREEHIISYTSIQLDGRPLRLSVWVHGDKSKHRLQFNFTDSEGETFQMYPPIVVNWTRWKRIKLDTSSIPKGWSHWGGNGDRVLDYPIKRFGLYFGEGEDEYTGRGAIYLDDVEIWAETGGDRRRQAETGGKVGQWDSGTVRKWDSGTVGQ